MYFMESVLVLSILSLWAWLVAQKKNKTTKGLMIYFIVDVIFMLYSLVIVYSLRQLNPFVTVIFNSYDYIFKNGFITTSSGNIYFFSNITYGNGIWVS